MKTIIALILIGICDIIAALIGAKIAFHLGAEEQEDDGEPFEEKMKRLTGELSEMFKQSDTLQNEIREKLNAIGWEI